MIVDENYLEKLQKHIDDVLTDKTENTLQDWIDEYGGTVNDTLTITFGSHYALLKMLERRDKEVIRYILKQLLKCNTDSHKH